jgi:glyoxalase family protein
MRLDGIDHITAITSDGQRCLDFYAGILGLPFVGRQRDFEAPDSHLIRLGRQPDGPEGVLTFIEAPGIRRGFAGNGMAHLLRWTVRRPAALDYWEKRLSGAGIEVHSPAGAREPSLRFADPEGLEHELGVEDGENGRSAGLSVGTSAIPREHAIVRLAGARAYGRESIPSADILAGRLAFRVAGPDSFAVGAGSRTSEFSFDPPPLRRGVLGAGTIHHVAWATDGALPAWRQRVIGMGCVATPVIDRGQRRSIYFREPSGVLFEIAAAGEAPAEPAEERVASTRRISPKVDPRIRAAAT